MLDVLPPAQWNFEKAAHLLNRAGFGGKPAQIGKIVEMGHKAAVDHFVDYERIPDNTPNPDWAHPDPHRFEEIREMKDASSDRRKELRKEEQRLQRERILQLRQWWLVRMAAGVRPLQEKLALFWHGHFATSAQKVRNAYFMWLQNETFRSHGSGAWLDLLSAVSKDPAMLVWLDQAQSRKEHPNENFARELMELFTLGEGSYTEADILEAARALTGWSLDRARQEFIYRPNAHDPGVKRIFGHSGSFTGDEVLKLALQKPESARFIVRKLWVFFGSENPSPELINALAAGFQSTGMQFKPLLRRMFLSQEFYSSDVMRQQVKSPVQWLVSGARMLERELPPPLVSANLLRMLGQDLFLPPNVKGWDGGLSWITTNNLLNRYNFGSFLIFGRNPIEGVSMIAKAKGNRPAGGGFREEHAAPVEAATLFPEDVRKDKTKFIAELERRLLQDRLRPNHRDSLREFLDSKGDIDDDAVLHAIHLVMSTPEFQLT